VTKFATASKGGARKCARSGPDRGFLSSHPGTQTQQYFFCRQYVLLVILRIMGCRVLPFRNFRFRPRSSRQLHRAAFGPPGFPTFILARAGAIPPIVPRVNTELFREREALAVCDRSIALRHYRGHFRVADLHGCGCTERIFPARRGLKRFADRRFALGHTSGRKRPVALHSARGPTDENARNR
jgi:hypothetical protein